MNEQFAPHGIWLGMWQAGGSAGHYVEWTQEINGVPHVSYYYAKDGPDAYQAAMGSLYGLKVDRTEWTPVIEW
jgi:hypothetical protein